MDKRIYQIQIVLKHYKPKIWRRILVDSDILLVDFHRIIQTTMGWTNSHIHMFTKGLDIYAPEEFEIDFAKNSRVIRLDQLLQDEKSMIEYEYDLGDNWRHTIILKKILPPNSKRRTPKCTAGKRSCPPEDCGGVWGYANMLKILKQPDHEEYESYIEWLGEDFDPENFDKDEINRLLMTKDYGCIWL
jgi:hypothetical protein